MNKLLNWLKGQEWRGDMDESFPVLMYILIITAIAVLTRSMQCLH